MSTRTLLAAGLIVALTLLPGCAPRRPAPAPVPPPAPAPAPPPPAPVVTWEEAPLSAGDWTYRDESGASSATFASAAGASFVMRCEPTREISLTRTGVQGGPFVIRTTFGERSLAASDQPAGLTARLAASDPLLDQMVFSRGRFAVESSGAPRLILPAWPEPAHVIEDCR